MSKGLLGDGLSSLHAQWAEAIDAAVGGAVSGGHLSLSQRARSVKSAVAVRYRVKRIDRLPGNASLEWDHHTAPAARSKRLGAHVSPGGWRDLQD